MINNSRVFIKQDLFATLSGNEGVAAVLYYIGTGAATYVGTSTTMTFTDTAAGAVLPADGTTGGGVLTFSVSTVNLMGKVAAVINASSGFRIKLAASLQSNVPTALLAVSSIAVTLSGLNLKWNQTTNKQLILAFGPEGDVNLDAYTASSRTSKSFLNDYRDPLLLLSAAKSIGRPFPFDTVSRLFRTVFSLGKSGGGAVPVMTVYDSNQTTDTQVFSLATTDLTVDDTTNTLNPPAEIQSTPGNRLVIVLISGSDTPTAANLEIHGGYGEPGLLV